MCMFALQRGAVCWLRGEVRWGWGAGGREGGTRVLLACGRGREAEWEGWAGGTKPSGREKSVDMREDMRGRVWIWDDAEDMGGTPGARVRSP